jgi:multidrug resistance efflux pump
MTATNNPSPKSPLKVVPPKAIAQPSPVPTPPVTPTPPAASPSKVPTPSKSYGKWLMMAIVLAGGVMVARMPISNYVIGEAEVTSRLDERQRLVMPVSGQIQLKVKSNAEVEEGDILAEVSSPEIENQVAEAERNLQHGNAALFAAQKRLSIAQTELQYAQKNVEIAQDRAEKKQREVQEVIAGNKLPRIRQIEAEISSIESEIDGVKNSQIGIESQMAGLQNEINAIELDRNTLDNDLIMLEQKIKRYQDVVEQGALAQNLLDDLHREKNNLTNQIEQRNFQIKGKHEQIEQTQSELLQRHNIIEQKQQLIAGKYEQIKQVEKEIEELRDERENEVEQQLGLQRSVEQKVEAAKVDIQSETQRVQKAEAELDRLRDRQATLILTADTAGTVLTPDLDLLDQNTVQSGQEIMRIVNLSQLTATVQVSQEDGNLVQEDQPVVFKVRDPYSPSYRAKVQEISRTIAPDKSGANPMLTLTILIDNPDQILRPGGQGFAHIETGQMRVYQKVQHELNKLFNLDKYFVGFSKE